MMKTKSRKTCLAVITARGGSKGVPRKNVRLLNGIPLIEYPIRLAKACPYISRVIVTTDCPKIRDAAIKGGAEAPFLRPAYLATDTARQEDAIFHVMDWCEAQGQTFDYLCLLCPTTPLGQVETLNRAFEQLGSRVDAEAIFSVVESEFSPLKCNTLKPNGLMKDWMDPKIKWLQRQEIPTYFRLSGLITVSTWAAFRREQTFLHDKTLSMIIDPVEAWDINTPLEFFIAERLLERGFFNSHHLYDYVRLDVNTETE